MTHLLYVAQPPQALALLCAHFWELRSGGSPALSCHGHCSLQVLVETHRTLDVIGWISSPLFLEGFYSQDPPCYKLRDGFFISSLISFLSSHLIIPLLRASFPNLRPWGQPDRDVQTHNEDISNPSAQTDPSGWDPLAAPWSLAAPSPWLPPRHGLTGIPIPRGPPCSTNPGKLNVLLGSAPSIEAPPIGVSSLCVLYFFFLFTKIKPHNELIKH